MLYEVITRDDDELAPGAQPGRDASAQAYGAEGRDDLEEQVDEGELASLEREEREQARRITSYNVCYTKLLRAGGAGDRDGE